MKYAEQLSEFALTFDPEALTGEDLQDFYYNGTMPIRTGDANESPMDDMYKACMLLKHQNAHLLLGHKGCGKSTELNVLKQRLEESGCKVSVIQCRLEADLKSINYWDLLILLGKHLCEIARDSGCALPDSLLDNIEDFWKEKEISETFKDDRGLALKGEISASTPKILKIVNLFAGLSTELKFGYEKREVLREKVKKSTTKWIGYMTEVSGRITQHLHGQQPIVIFEDLDKLIPPEKAWEIFSDTPLSEMPFPVIYTFPISLSYDPKFAGLKASFSINILPMIKIRTPDGNLYQHGIDIIKGIIEKRADLSLFDEEALTFLIKKTGGILRDLFGCITKSANRAENRQAVKIELEDAQSATKQLSSSLTRLIETDNYPLLINIYKGGKYKRQIEDKAMLLSMMQGLIVLEYNSERWHDLHPLIEDYLKKQGEVQ